MGCCLWFLLLSQTLTNAPGANYYCEYCGTKYSSISSLTANTCSRHPDGVHQGRHKLYEGSEKSQYFCEYCGTKYSSISSLTANTCSRHPDGVHQGRHKVYKGSEKSRYTCKYCGSEYSSISSLTANTCSRHPNGPHKGNHSPALWRGVCFHLSSLARTCNPWHIIVETRHLWFMNYDLWIMIYECDLAKRKTLWA